MRDQEGLISRIRRLRRVSADADAQATRPPKGGPRDDLLALESRVEHLEQLVQGLQDSVHRESKRLSSRLGDLEAQVQPAAIGKALSEDARKRGL